MKIIVLDSVNSTQDYLKNILESLEINLIPQHLVYTHQQLQGYGRQKSQWEHTKGSIACSFNMKPHKIFTLSSLEVAVLISNFFFETLNISIKFKWPNDLFYKDKKLGGIIIHSVKGELCVGVGINHDTSNSVIDEESMRIGINLVHFKIEKLVTYIHNNRIKNPKTLKQRWLKDCHHINKSVSVDNQEGIFVGLGPYGEAQIKQVESLEVINCISGSLRYI